MRKTLTGILIGILAVGGLAVPANATQQEEPPTEACYEQIPTVQLEKHTRERSKTEVTQHYSWTGGQRGYFDPPTWPDEAWQANTTHEPHNNVDYWFNTPLHRTGSLHKANWFYFETGLSDWSEWSTPTAYGTHLEWVDADSIPEPNWQEHGNSYTDTYQRDWALLPNGNEGFRDGDQVPCEDQPPAETRDESTLDCYADTITTVFYETPYILDENFEWVPGEEVVVDTQVVDATEEDCPPEAFYYWNDSCDPFTGEAPQLNVQVANTGFHSLTYIVNGEEITVGPHDEEFRSYNFEEDEGNGEVIVPLILPDLTELEMVVDTDCEDPPPPPPPPSAPLVDPPSEEPPTTTPPAAAPPAAPTPTPNQPKELPVTGAMTLPLVAAGLSLMGGGWGIRRFGKKR